MNVGAAGPVCVGSTFGKAAAGRRLSERLRIHVRQPWRTEPGIGGVHLRLKPRVDAGIIEPPRPAAGLAAGCAASGQAGERIVRSGRGGRVPARVHDGMIFIHELLVLLHLLLRRRVVAEAESIGQGAVRRASGERAVADSPVRTTY